MQKKIKILILEDSEMDAQLICWQIQHANIPFDRCIVDNKNDFVKALNDYCPDLILSDHTLPGFNSLEALKIIIDKGIKIPFILVTDTMSEEFAVEIMKNGAWDYVSKKQIKLLPEAITLAMNKYKIEKVRRDFLYEAILTEAYMQEAERIAHYGSWEYDVINKKLKLSKKAHNILGYFADETETSYENIFKRIHPEELEKVKNLISYISNNSHQEVYKGTFSLIDKDGKYRIIKTEFVLKHNLNHKLLCINGFIQDLTILGIVEDITAVSETNLVIQEKVMIEDAVIFLNNIGRVFGSNIEAQNILGYSGDELIGKPVSFLYENMETQQEDFNKYSNNTRKQVRFENKNFYIRKDGTRLWADVVITTLLDKKKRLSGFMMVMREINVPVQQLTTN